MSSILFADDEESLREFLVIMFEKKDYQVVTASTVEKTTNLILENEFDLILTDIRMGRSNGLDVLDGARNILSDTHVVMKITSAETAVTAMKKLAYVYIPKPFKIEGIQLVIKNTLEKRQLVAKTEI